jgi:hypothetical protein
MDGWDIALLAAAAYMAITALARLMIRHRNQVLDDLRRQIERSNGDQQSDNQTTQRKQSA